MNLLVFCVAFPATTLCQKKLYKQETKYTNKASAQTTDKQSSQLEKITHRALKHTNDK